MAIFRTARAIRHRPLILFVQPLLDRDQWAAAAQSANMTWGLLDDPASTMGSASGDKTAAAKWGQTLHSTDVRPRLGQFLASGLRVGL